MIASAAVYDSGLFDVAVPRATRASLRQSLESAGFSEWKQFTTSLFNCTFSEMMQQYYRWKLGWDTTKALPYPMNGSIVNDSDAAALWKRVHDRHCLLVF